MTARALAAAALLAATVSGQEPTDRRAALESGLRAYFAAAEPPAEVEEQLVALAEGHEELLADVLRTKSFVSETGRVARRGRIDDAFRFVDDPARENPAFFHGPSTEEALAPLAVYVPDVTDTASFEAQVVREGVERGWFVLVVPDYERDNDWTATKVEHGRHTGPLRELLLTHRVDPDRVFFVGTGRGGHATWDVGLLHADRFAGLFPCNGGTFHQGGYALSGGVFLPNAQHLVIRTVYNTSFDHGIEACRVAGERFAKWKFDFEAVEEPRMRHMGLAEATAPFADVRRDPYPTEIQKRFNWVETGRHHWLEALDREPGEWDPAERLTIRGSWPSEPRAQRERVWEVVEEQCGWLEGTAKPHRVTVKTNGVSRVRVWFAPELVEFGRTVPVKIDGKTRGRVELERDVATMLREVHRTGDTSRLYWAYHDFDAG